MIYINEFAKRKNKEEALAVKWMLEHPLTFEECIAQRDRNRAAIENNWEELTKVKVSFNNDAEKGTKK